jgi:histidinol-phosphate aminotransferase
MNLKNQDIDFSKFIRSHIRSMVSYTPIHPFEVLSKQSGIPVEDIIKLDANENPYGPLPAVRGALKTLPYPHIYPDPESRDLRRAISLLFGVPFQNILAGAGADELIDLIMRALLNTGDAIIDCPPTFGMYAFDATINTTPQYLNISPKSCSWRIPIIPMGVRYHHLIWIYFWIFPQ